MYEELQESRFAIVASRFNREIVEKLVEGAQSTFVRYQVKEAELFWVPGAFEIPLMAKRLAESGRFDGIVCVGAVIRGETAHFEHVGNQAASGILQNSLQHNIPIIFSVLTTENVAQAKARIKEGARGAHSLIEMVHALSKVEKVCD